MDSRGDRRFYGLEFGERQLGQYTAQRFGSLDDHAGGVMGLAKRQSSDSDKPIGKVGRGAETPHCRGVHTLSVGSHIAYHAGGRCEAELKRISSFEERNLVLL